MPFQYSLILLSENKIHNINKFYYNVFQAIHGAFVPMVQVLLVAELKRLSEVVPIYPFPKMYYL